MVILGSQDPMLLSELINNTTKYNLQINMKKMKFEIKQMDTSGMMGNQGFDLFGGSKDSDEINTLRSEN